MVFFPGARPLASFVIIRVLVPAPEMKPRQSVMQKRGGLRNDGQPGNRSQEVPRRKPESSNHLTRSAAAADLRLR